MTYQLSTIGQKFIQLSGVRAIMLDIKKTLHSNKQEIINLSAGNPLLIPEMAQYWRKALQEVANSDESDEVMGRYGDSQGHYPFIHVVRDYLNSQLNWSLKEENILVTPGSQQAYFYIINLFCDTKRKLLLPSNPDYTGYASNSVYEDNVLSVNPVPHKGENNEFIYSLNKDALDALSDDIGLVAFSRPSNPTGGILSDEDFDYLIKWGQKRGVPVVVDCAYSEPFPDIKHRSIAMPQEKGLVYCFSLSKAGFPGGRLGVVTGDTEIIEGMEAFQANINIHASKLSQAVASRVLQESNLQDLCQQHIAPFYQSNQQCLFQCLQDSLGDIPWYMHRYEGTMFSWLWFPELSITDLELYDLLKEQGLLVVPGSMFFHHPESLDPNQLKTVRVSLTATKEQIRKGAAILSEVVRENSSSE